MVLSRNDRLVLVWNSWRSASSAYDLVQISETLSDDDRATVLALLKDATSILYRNYEQEVKRGGYGN